MPHTAYVALKPIVVRGSSLFCMTYVANCPCGEGLVVVPSPIAILGKGFVGAFFGERLIVALLDRCVLLGVLAVLILGAVHAIFGVLAVLALGNVHAFSNVLTKHDLSIFLLLVVAWCNMVVSASCKQQHIIFDCCVGIVHVLPLHLSVIVVASCNMTIKNYCRVIEARIVESQSILLLALCAFVNVDVVDPH